MLSVVLPLLECCLVECVVADKILVYESNGAEMKNEAGVRVYTRERVPTYWCVM